MEIGEKLNAERQALGVHLSCHPLEQFQAIAELIVCHHNQISTNIVLANSIEQLKTKSNMAMLHAEIEDLSGTKTKAVLFPSTYTKYGHYFQPGTPLLICGRIGSHKGVPQIEIELALPAESIVALLISFKDSAQREEKRIIREILAQCRQSQEELLSPVVIVQGSKTTLLGKKLWVTASLLPIAVAQLQWAAIEALSIPLMGDS